ncbi:MAG: hypothetical protein COV29_01045 [Candidatus Yanofskybacteria bacterium CG10_big_fil_rev_8_21_14_0_10_36_16]|uniref:O-antigen ligase-related domain-containing protein n=1 Tax=Candidatus Yanofskybacteria bacterium CG10_big_fil_rev_8_21_14_0_10_36_16 TaxID=1975096 RepID=A0A2J0Q847_9BACT|nr:MAG: hypothetical protein COV29_01045 [Candidatus Yanofskybacteria bacterium CG10_big_fil_rev_8_21_14_0_10_36_16]
MRFRINSQNLEKALFYLLLFAIPFEIKKHLWSWGRFNVEWTSGFLWVSDLLIIGLLILWLVRSKFKFRLKPDLIEVCLLAFFIISGLSIFIASIKPIAIFQFVKLAEFIGLFFYIRYNFEKVFYFVPSLMTLVFSGFIQAFIAISQSVTQGVLGLKYFGEPVFKSLDTIGVAVFYSEGVKFLRAYGTTPHPNVLAAFLFFGIFSFYWLYLTGYKETSEIWHKKIYEYGILAVYAIMLLAFFSTFSRIIIGFWALGVTAHIVIILTYKKFGNFRKHAQTHIYQLVVVTGIVAGLFSLVYWPQLMSRINVSIEEEAITHRVRYNHVAGDISNDRPLLGIGLGQFVPEFMEREPNMHYNFYQPVHNIYLLILSETGYFGFLFLAVFLFVGFKKFIRSLDFTKVYHYSFVIFVVTVLAFGIFDHFTWTLQMGRLMLWITLGFISAIVLQNIRYKKRIKN